MEDVVRTNGEAAGEGFNGRFASGVDSVVVHPCCLGRDTRDENQAAGRREVFVGLLRDEELAAGVDVENAVEVFGSDFIDGAKVLEAFVMNSQPSRLHLL